MKLITIIIPVFNSENKLARCLKSVCRQSYPCLEIICVNDGSTDNSLKLLKKFKASDNRIKIISKRNGGPSSARNAGLEISTGDYICFVDSDDFIEPEMIQQLFGLISRTDSQLAVGRIKVTYESAKQFVKSDDEFFRVRFSGEVLLTGEHLLLMDVYSFNKMFRRDLIEKFNIRFPEGLLYEDAPFLWSYLHFCERATFTDQVVYNYVRGSGSIMDLTYRKKSLKALDHLIIFDSFMKNISKYGVQNRYYKEVILLMISYFRVTLRLLPWSYKIQAVIYFFRLQRFSSSQSLNYNWASFYSVFLEKLLISFKRKIYE